MDRRKFIKILGAGATLAAIPWKFNLKNGLQWAQAHAFANSPGLTKYAQNLRGIDVIPVATPDALLAPVTGVQHFTIDISEFTDTLHPALGPTHLWGYNPAPNGIANPSPRHLGGIMVARRGIPVQITFRNNLNVEADGVTPLTQHILPNDLTVVPPGNVGDNRVAVHLHGGFVPWISDGGPFDWWTPAGATGLSFLNNVTLNPGALPNEAEYYYPNDQSARMMWYHDHAVGITRLNAYAGIATAYIIRDAFEDYLVANNYLPAYIEDGGRELPIVIQDKIFVGPNTLTLDPTWATMAPARVQNQGSLWYEHVYDPKVFKLVKSKNNLPNPSIVTEFWADTMLANGTVYPKVTVDRAQYRFRILNACNSRFVNLQMYVADSGNPDYITLNPVTQTPANGPGPDWLLIGTEGGFIPVAKTIPGNAPFNPLTLYGSLVLAPAERADVIVDFSGFAPGTKIILYNDAPAPYPVGSPLNDYYLGNPLNPIQPVAGQGPDSRQIMMFEVSNAAPALPLEIGIGTDLRVLAVTAGQTWNDPLLVDGPTVVNGAIQMPTGANAPAMTRMLTLNEEFDNYGRLKPSLGLGVPVKGKGFGLNYLDPATETPTAGTVEVWQIANLTGDTHPIHFHLVNAQVLARQTFKPQNFKGTPAYIGLPRLPDPDESGWKETVRMHPGEVTTVAMKFTLPEIKTAGGAVIATPVSPRTGGHEYVYHCHILEHEEHDMMRPLVVV